MLLRLLIWKWKSAIVFEMSFKEMACEVRVGFKVKNFLSNLVNCSWTKFIAIIVNVCVFFIQNFRLTILTFRLTFTPLTFCASRDLKFSLNHNFKQLNSIGGNLILKVKWKVHRNVSFFFTLNLNSGIW